MGCVPLLHSGKSGVKREGEGQEGGIIVGSVAGVPSPARNECRRFLCCDRDSAET